MNITINQALFCLLIIFMLSATPVSASPSSENLIDAGYIALESGDNRMAEDLFTRALALSSGDNSPTAWAGLGKALWNDSSASNEASYTAFNRSLECVNVSSEDWNAVVMVFFNDPVEDFELSYSAGLKAVEADPEDDVAWNYFGCVIDRLAHNNSDADLNEPFDAFKKAMTLNPTPLYSCNTAYYAIITGNYSYAVEVTDQAVKYYNPDNWWEGDLLFFKAFALAEMGESEEALKNIELSRKFYSSDESFEWNEYYNTTDGMVSAVALNNLGRFDESAEILSRIDTDKLDDNLEGLLFTPERYMDLYGVALSGLGRTDDAAIAFEKSLEYNSDYIPAMEHLNTQNQNRSP
ncbi:tetratricopeptide repeat protein [Methanoplanus endosymbiosus]|uniref:Tetratricopeptide repeat protein n=1 Tax=Methanoplanus endosymbiosus TaxID=33865 RepID=A0A9E7TJS8_9EURY|nr:tetratricopeptide repeat protein [Methanoplanus endosymbiosus]UUX92129.1 tetratricopeptide repeat protein [Methanoplanus endosymbiosus]